MFERVVLCLLFELLLQALDGAGRLLVLRLQLLDPLLTLPPQRLQRRVQLRHLGGQVTNLQWRAVDYITGKAFLRLI